MIGVISLRSALDDNDQSARACALLAILGCINVVVIKYSVEWWNTLHQPASAVTIGSGDVNGPEFWVVTLLMILGVYLFMGISLILSTRNEILEREKNAVWVQEIVDDS